MSTQVCVNAFLVPQLAASYYPRFGAEHLPLAPGSVLQNERTDQGAEEESKACARIVIIEDNPGDVFIMQEALREHRLNCELTVLWNGEEALTFFDTVEEDPSKLRPDLVLLDLNLPKHSGHRILERIRKTRRCFSIPVVIVSSSESPIDLEENRRLGATAYFRKPSDLDMFLKLGELVTNLLSR